MKSKRCKISNEMKFLLDKIEMSTTSERAAWKKVDELLAKNALTMTREERIRWMEDHSQSVYQDANGYYVWVCRIGQSQTIARLSELTDEELQDFASQRPKSFPAEKVIVDSDKVARALASLI